MGKALRLVDYPVHDWEEQGQRGVKDPQLIPWLAEQALVWITKDDAAKRAHIEDIRRAGISVVWVRGLEREKNHISPHQLHLMLAVKLPTIAARLSGSRSARHFELYCHGDELSPKVVCQDLVPEQIRTAGRVGRARVK